MYRRVFVRSCVVLLIIFANLLLPSLAHAAFVPGGHIKDWGVTYRLHTPSLNASQRAMIDLMADKWNVASRMSLTRGTDTTSGSPFGSTSMRLLWEVDLPPTGFFGACTETSLACTATDPAPEYAYHFLDIDTALNADMDWIAFSNSQDCLNGIKPDGSRTDSNDRDQRSVSLHEFGHWQYLSDDEPTGAYTMAGYSSHKCKWTIDSISAGAVDDLYADHPAGQ